ncbi:rhomboid family intramembrane serine protease [Tellurirhabdus rosea]|uniref:rhomboid family intramembrane serine protease n=1 Tax=Tellurirhabdus rosea TaxID=2674997 RepID=UPI0022564FE1
MLTPVVRTILLLNIGLFFVSAAGISLIDTFGLHSFLSPLFKPHQLVTHMFLHAGFGHIFSNMLGLFFFGPRLEEVWGSKRFTIFYFFTGIGAGLLFSLVNYYEMSQVRDALAIVQENLAPDVVINYLDRFAPDLFVRYESLLTAYEQNPGSGELGRNVLNLVNSSYQEQVNVPMVGASGAIFGILMAFGLLFPNTELFLLFPPIPIKAKYLVAFYGAYEIYSGVYKAHDSNVAHFAHIGGMLFAYLLVRYWGTQRNKFY